MRSTSLQTTLLWLCVLTLVWPCSGRAQQGRAEVTLRFVAFPSDRDASPMELLLADGSTLEIRMPGNELSRPLKVPGMDQWVFGKTIEDAADGPVFKPLAKTRALDSPAQLILLVRMGQADGEGLNVFVIDNRRSGFDGGRFLFLNASTMDVSGEGGGERFVIRPGAYTILKPSTETGEAKSHAMFYFRAEDKARPFFSSRWPVSDAARGLIFFYHDPGTGHLRIHSIRDFEFSRSVLTSSWGDQ